MLSKKKKIIILSSMLVLLVVTGWLNIVLNTQKPADADTGGVVQTGNFFTTSRTDRINTRNQTVLILDTIINSEASSQEAIDDANRQKLELTSAMTMEQKLEELIAAGEDVEDCLVTVGAENVNVIVKCEEFTDLILSRVYNIVKSETGKTARYVHIIPIE